MKNLFWSIIGLILILAVISLTLYSGVEEVVTEPLPENIASMISELRIISEEMAGKYALMQETINIALTAGTTRNAQTWFGEAEKIEADLINIYNTKALPLENRLHDENLTESAEKQVNEFMGKLSEFISTESLRNTLTSKRNLGLRVNTSDWNALAIMYRNLQDKYERNVGLRALAETVRPFDDSLAESFFEMLDAPYFIALHKIEYDSEINIEELLRDINDPYLEVQVLLELGKKKLDDAIIEKLTGILDKFVDDNEKAFAASRILTQLPRIPNLAQYPFFEAIEKADDPNLLKLETKVTIAEKTGEIPFPATEIAALAQNYPRERMLARAIMHGSKDMTMQEINQALEDFKIKSPTLMEQVLTHIALNKEGLDDKEFDVLIDRMHDPYSRLVSKLDRFNKTDLPDDAAVKYLEPLAGLLEDVQEPQPKIDYAAALAQVDPFRMRQFFSQLDLKIKADAAEAIIDALDDNETSLLIIDDVYAEISRSSQLEALEKAQLLRKLGGAALKVNRAKAMSMLEEAISVLNQM